ncbi:hypothetical protein [Paenibacillus abyssi]|uniref:Uncharacterized protein n=1 Tax=Paenibacillus abyssi TaxID=1340531 RepID=A0A917FVV1_9BACL|nr:hypothetical protein [Paenibacillus abyssi]GGG07729.1 hypothetical protein GCM10010916_25790 [Paenibacillus abyssi]
MKQRAGKLENILIKVTIVMLFGFGVGMISIREDWMTAIEERQLAIGCFLSFDTLARM